MFNNKSDIEQKLFYFNIEKKLAILPIFLMLTGTIGNVLALYVLTRKRLRVYSTMLYFASLTVVDTISLYQWNFNFFYRYHLDSSNNNLEESSLFLCRYISFMAYFSLQTSAWILALICIDRYLILTNSYWKKKFYKNTRFTVLIIIIIVLIVFLINLPVAFLNGKIVSKVIKIPTKYNKTNRNHHNNHNRYTNQTHYISNEIECYTTKFVKFYEKIMLCNECLIPLILMITFNTLLIYKTHQSSKRFKAIEEKEKQRLLLSNTKDGENSVDMTRVQERLSIINKNFRYILNLNKNESINLLSKIDNKLSALYLKNSSPDLNKNIINDEKIQNEDKKSIKSAQNDSNIISDNREITNRSSCIKEQYLQDTGGSININCLTTRTRLNSRYHSSPNLLHNITKTTTTITATNGNNITGINSNNNSNSNLTQKSAFLAPPSPTPMRPRLNYSNSLKLTPHSGNKINNTCNLSHLNRSSSSILKNKSNTQLKAYLKEITTIIKNHDDEHEMEPLDEKLKKISIEINQKQLNDDLKLIKKRKKFLTNSRLSQRRNRKIIIMLILLTASFALSTFPSAMFYSFFRPFISNQPYRRLLTLTFNLLRHLSHTFNFLIYFKYSSVIKQELNTIINFRKLKYLIKLNCVKFMHFWCSCCCCCIYYYMDEKFLNNKFKITSNTSTSMNNNGSENVNNRSKFKKSNEFTLNHYTTNEMNNINVNSSSKNVNSNNIATYDNDNDIVEVNLKLNSSNNNSISNRINNKQQCGEQQQHKEIEDDDDDDECYTDSKLDNIFTLSHTSIDNARSSYNSLSIKQESEEIINADQIDPKVRNRWKLIMYAIELANLNNANNNSTNSKSNSNRNINTIKK